jgi:spermidine synthase
MSARAKNSRKGQARPAAKAPTATPANARTLWSRPAFWAALATIVLAGGAFAWLAVPEPEREPVDLATLQPGLVTRVESLYNDISLYKQNDGNLLLSFGAARLNYIESVVNPNDELDLPVYYTQSMTAGIAYAPALEDAAIIGLGGGRTAWYHHKSIPGLKFTAVELDPEVARLAETYFRVRPEQNFDVVIEDGRVWLSRTDQKFDLIMVDAYRGPFVPFHLLTTEFYELVSDHLKPGGVVIQNVEPSTMLFDSAVATIGAAFQNLEFFQSRGNIVIVGYNGPKRDEAELKRIASGRQAQYDFRYDLNAILDRRYRPTWNEATKPLTDDFAPVEYLKAIERHNEKQT